MHNQFDLINCKCEHLCKTRCLQFAGLEHSGVHFPGVDVPGNLPKLRLCNAQRNCKKSMSYMLNGHDSTIRKNTERVCFVWRGYHKDVSKTNMAAWFRFEKLHLSKETRLLEQCPLDTRDQSEVFNAQHHI